MDSFLSGCELCVSHEVYNNIYLYTPYIKVITSVKYS